MTGDDALGGCFINLPPFVSNLNEYNTAYRFKSLVASRKSQVVNRES